MKRTLLALLVLLACFGACKKDGDKQTPTPEAKTAALDAAVATTPVIDAAPLGAVAAAKDFTAKVCACKDDACGQKVMDDASQKMPALMQTATEDDRKAILASRDEAVACMDKLVDQTPVAVSAIAEGDAFSKEACACTDAACAEAVVAKHRELLKQGMTASMSRTSSGNLMTATATGTSCLDKIGYIGTADPALAATAKSTADAVCACKDEQCAMDALRAGAPGMAGMVTPADRNAVTAASDQAQKCVEKFVGAPGSDAKIDMQALADKMVADTCACKDIACAEKAVNEMAVAIGRHDITQDDLTIMTAAAEKADACRGKLPK